MSRLRLDRASQEAKSLAWALFLGALCGLTFGPAGVRVWGGPTWLSLAVVLLSVLGVVVAIALVRKVRCPGCTRPLLFQLSPTWIKPPRPRGEPEVMCCPHCHEEIDLSGGTSPPSNISLQRDRVP